METEEVIELVEETVGPYTGEVVRAKEAPYMDDFPPEEIKTLKRVASLFGKETGAERVWHVALAPPADGHRVVRGPRTAAYRVLRPVRKPSSRPQS